MTFSATSPVIDNMEGSEPHGDTDNGMPGHWWCAGDGSAGATSSGEWEQSGGMGYYNVLLDPPRDGSLRAMAFDGQGFTSWGVAIGISINSCVDASAYTGIEFWAKSNTSSGFSSKFRVGTYETEAVRDGYYSGGCTGTCDGSYETEVSITTEWTKVSVPFCELVAQAAATSLPFAKSKISSLAWSVPPNTNFDLYIDDVAFY